MQLRVIFATAALLLAPGIAVAQSAAPAAAPASPPASVAPSPTPTPDLGAERIIEIFTVKHISPDWFTPDLLTHLPLAKIEDFAAQLNFGIGPFKVVGRPTERIATDPPAPWVRYVAIFKEGTDDVLIHINDDGKIDGLVFRTPRSAF
jgi:hypothetical protein